MRHRSALVSLLWLLTAAGPVFGAASGHRDFVTVRGDQLMEGDRPFRFLSFNIPNLHLVEDNMVFTDDNAWRWPDRFEVADALTSIRQQGGQVVRTYVLSVVRSNEPAGLPRHVLGPGQFNEEGFRVLDEVLALANETGVRVIVPFVDNWSWWGGIAEYAGFRGKPKEAFWTDPQVIADFKETVRHLVTRTNTLTGVRYSDDPAILCWETGNELQSPAAWTREIAAYIKRLDRKHPVMDGYHTTELRAESLEMPEVDIVTTHHYPGGDKTFATLVRENWAKAKGRKPYVVGEFGFVAMPQMAAAIDAVMETGTAGGLAWSLRFRTRDGGFYWHSEPAGGDKYKAFHWPGFSTGADYDEASFLALLQRKAFEIRGLPVPALTPPAAPRLLPIPDVASIRWQGAVGAIDYVVERAARANGPWTTAAEGVDETAVQYRPLFADMKVGAGRWYYRVRARNAAGLSEPSNVVGPVAVTQGVLVDELADLGQIAEKTGTLEIRRTECRKAKEDIHRLAGKPDSAIVYRLPGPGQAVKVYALFPQAVADFKVSASADGKAYAPVTGRQEGFFGGAGDYGYWKPALYQCPALPGEARFVRIEFLAEAQISRIELTYGFAQ